MEFKVTLFVAVLAGSCFMFANPATAATGEGDDVLKKSMELLGIGSENTAKFIERIKQGANTVDEIMKKTEKKMEQIIDLIGSESVRNTRLTSEVFKKYYTIRKNIRAGRRRLRRLAYKTKTACKHLELYLEGWGKEFSNQEKKFYLQEQLDIMGTLVKESIKILKAAEKDYETAIDNIDGFINPHLSLFRNEIKRMVKEYKQSDVDSWASDVRGSVYGTGAGVTVGLLVADFLGCFGFCSIIGNSIYWGASIPAAELSISSFKAAAISKVEELKDLGESALADVKVLKDSIPTLVEKLERELELVSNWKESAKHLGNELDTIDLHEFATMSLYRQTVEEKVVALREAAEKYLNQTPVVLFPTGRRKRSLPEKILVRKHERNF